MKPPSAFLVVLTLSALAAACGSEIASRPELGRGATTAPLAETDSDLQVILAYGDSLTSGEGVDRDRTYPAQLQAELDRLGYAYRVVNQGVSGDTTSGGVARLDGALALQPEIVILALGGNDGLRGMPVEVAHENIRTMIEAFEAAGTRIVLAAMTLPLNYGPDYIQSFEAIYTDLAEEFDVVLFPFFEEDMIEDYELYIQSDGIHPTGEGYEIVTRRLLEILEPYLSQ